MEGQRARGPRSFFCNPMNNDDILYIVFGPVACQIHWLLKTNSVGITGFTSLVSPTPYPRRAAETSAPVRPMIRPRPKRSEVEMK